MSISRTPLSPERSLGSRRALEHVLLGLLPVLLTGLVVYRVYANGIEAVDFRHTFWVAGWRTLHGLSPYVWTRSQISGGVSFPYPALTALLLAPLGLLSSFPESIPITAAAVFAAPLTLRILEVRDWRVYGAVVLWAPVVVAWQTANFTLPLVVGTALLWRFRDRRLLAAALVAVLVSVKPILVPLWVWLVFTRRWRAALAGVAIGVVLNAASWTVLGWHELSGWLSLVSLQGKRLDGTGYSLIALADHLGFSRMVGYALMILFSCGAVGFAAFSARAGRELGVFSAMVLLTLGISPQADSHYFALLMVPLALRRPVLSWHWVVPLLLWVCPATSAHGWQIVVWWSLVGTVAYDVLRSDSRRDQGELDRAAPPGRRGARTEQHRAGARQANADSDSTTYRHTPPGAAITGC